MFNKDFFPTPQHVIKMMLIGENIENKVILEPSAGKGDIVDYLKENGAREVLACEKDENLRSILGAKCRILCDDFLKLESHQVSHIQLIVMNPPFSADEKHISHAFNIAPAGCKIVALCNAATFENAYTSARKEFVKMIENHGTFENIEDVFNEDAERKTSVEIGLIHITKPGGNYETEFNGFFLEEDETEEQTNGIMSYNLVRDIVNRYIESVKIFDEQMKTAIRLNELTGEFMCGNMENLSIAVTSDQVPVNRDTFKKCLQRDAWKYIFEKLNMEKYATQQLKEDINKFVEEQEKVPFTMRNVYKMLEIVIGTTGSRMNKAIEVVFDKITKHYDENRFGLEGWKTNSHYLLNRKFIVPNMAAVDKWHTGQSICNAYGHYFHLIEDMAKAVCYITGDNYDKFASLSDTIRMKYKCYVNGFYNTAFYEGDRGQREMEALKKECYKEGKKFEVVVSEPEYGKLFQWGFFTVRAYKKGTMHFEFTDKKVWEMFNRKVAEIKGYPLPEAVKKEAAKPKPAANTSTKVEKSKVLATFNV